MSHNDYVRLDGMWPPETVPTPGDARALDVAQFQAVDGDAGGTWAPATPIALGGRGLALVGGSHQIAGGVLTRVGGRVVLGHSDMPTFKTPAVRNVLMPLLVYGNLYLPVSVPPTRMPFLRRSLSAPGTIISQALPVGVVTFPIDKRYLHNGATLASGVLGFAIGTPHAALPAQQPSVTLVRNDFIDGTVCFGFIASAPYAVPELVIPSVPNGFFYSVTTGGSASTEPSWPTSYGTTVTTGGVTFTCEGPTWSGSPTYGDPHAWAASASIVPGRVIQPSPATGQWFVCTAGGTTGSSAPAWGTRLGAIVTDGSVTWSDQGAILPILSGQLAAGTAAAYFAGGLPQTLTLSAITGGPAVIDTTAFSYRLLVSDESGSGSISPSLNRFIAAQLSYTAIADMRFE